MRILIDGDGCPVVDRAISVAHDYHTPCLIFCDTAHRFERQGAVTVTVDKGADSADFALVAQVRPEDIVVTQDYGLAAMCLSRGAAAIRQDGLIYDESNIDGLLEIRHQTKKIRAAGGRLKGPPKRQPQEDDDFEAALRMLLDGKEKGRSPL